MTFRAHRTCRIRWISERWQTDDKETLLGLLNEQKYCTVSYMLPRNDTNWLCFDLSTWVSPRNIRAQFHLSSTLTLDAPLPSFTLSLMIGLQLWLPTLMLFQTSTPILGPGSLVICASSYSNAAKVLTSNQTEVAAAMDKDLEVQLLPVPPLPESELRSPTSTVPSTPLETPRPLTPMSQTR